MQWSASHHCQLTATATAPLGRSKRRDSHAQPGDERLVHQTQQLLPLVISSESGKPSLLPVLPGGLVTRKERTVTWTYDSKKGWIPTPPCTHPCASSTLSGNEPKCCTCGKLAAEMDNG